MALKGIKNIMIIKLCGKGVRVVRISHRMNGRPDDVACQEVSFLRGINGSLASGGWVLGLVSHSLKVQPDTRLVRKLGFWRVCMKGMDPKSFGLDGRIFSFTLDVPGGVALGGAVLTSPEGFDGLISLAEKLPVSLFFWGRRAELLADYFNALGSVVFLDCCDGVCSVSGEALSDMCKRVEGFVCIPNLELDLDDADLLIVDPLGFVKDL